MSRELIDDLQAEIAKGRVIAIVGAGVSIGASQDAPAASWREEAPGHA
jgi:hypothetical protein